MAELTIEEENNFLYEILTEAERGAIENALKAVKPWDHKQFQQPNITLLVSVKQKLKDFHNERTNFNCCYCRRSLNDASIETDREHIVPKSKFKNLSYSLFNLSVACKRCNMAYKKEKVDHIVNHASIETDLRNPERYLIPHPNIDVYEEHLERFSIQFASKEVTSYKINSPKGQFLYEFVKLRHLCVKEFDVLQGGNDIREPILLELGIPLEGI